MLHGEQAGLRFQKMPAIPNLSQYLCVSVCVSLCLSLSSVCVFFSLSLLDGYVLKCEFSTTEPVPCLSAW